MLLLRTLHVPNQSEGVAASYCRIRRACCLRWCCWESLPRVGKLSCVGQYTGRWSDSLRMLRELGIRFAAEPTATKSGQSPQFWAEKSTATSPTWQLSTKLCRQRCNYSTWRFCSTIPPRVVQLTQSAACWPAPGSVQSSIRMEAPFNPDGTTVESQLSRQLAPPLWLPNFR